MLRMGMKTTTLIDRYKEENTESESHKTEVDNGVHPQPLGYVSGSLSNGYQSN